VADRGAGLPRHARAGKRIDKYEFVRNWLEVSGNQPNEDMVWSVRQQQPEGHRLAPELFDEEVVKADLHRLLSGP
jgi:hypothetical protein